MITIIGAGRVGSAAAFNILRYRIGDVVLIDVYENIAKGEALDMMQAAPAIEFDGKIKGTSDYSEMSGSELVIVTAGEARKPGMSRIDLMNKNAKTVRSLYLQGEYGFSDVTIGVPAVLGRNGLEKILELELQPETRKRFENSVMTVKEAINGLEF